MKLVDLGLARRITINRTRMYNNTDAATTNEIDGAGSVGLADAGGEEVCQDESEFNVGGTLGYLSPELWQHGSHGLAAPADWWAFGVLLYEMMTGYLPFCGGMDAAETKRKVPETTSHT